MKDDKFLYKLRRKLQVLAFKVTSPEFVSCFYYKHMLHKKLDLKNPVGFNEKIQWLKLYEWPNNKKAIMCSDKYLVREYIISKGYGEYLNDFYHVWESVDDIEWETLPNQFVLKCVHGCAYNLICSNKKEFDIEYAKKKLKQWTKEKFGYFNAEIHYNTIKPRIICEKFLGGDITDYKFYCFNGKPMYMYIATGFGPAVDERISFVNIDGTLAEFQRTDYPLIDKVVLPSHFEEMKQISEDLCSDFPFVRVDFFEVEGKIYFAELTFTPCGGLMTVNPPEWDIKLGNMLDISDLVKKKNAKKR